MQISFDEKNGIYSFQFLNEKAVESDVIQNLVLDYNRTGKIIGIEVFPFDVEKKVMKSGKKVTKSK